MDSITVTDEEIERLRQEVAIRRQADEVVRRVLSGGIAFDFASPRLQTIIAGVEELEQVGKKKRDLAEERRVWFQEWYDSLGFKVEVPLPTVNGKPVSNREFKRRAEMGQTLSFRPATSEVSYVAFMVVGQAHHWTLKDDEQDKIVWEPAQAGYWFWAETVERCPRTGTSHDKLSEQITLLCLEEYVIVWHAHKAQTGELLDVHTRTWLRTGYRFVDVGLGALDAFGWLGGVRVLRPGPEDLAVGCAGGGGRAMEKLAA